MVLCHSSPVWFLVGLLLPLYSYFVKEWSISKCKTLQLHFSRIPGSLRGIRQSAHEQTRARMWSSVFVSPNTSFCFVRVKLFFETLHSLMLFLKCSQSVDCKLMWSSLSNLFLCHCPWSRVGLEVFRSRHIEYAMSHHHIFPSMDLSNFVRRSADWLSY
jgi:hypothetical protein